MILVIDNYDSFTFNLVQYLGELGAELQVHRNDKIKLSEIADVAPNGIVISPGPGRPEHAGITVELIKQVAGQIPLLGVCLGHQAIGLAFGGRIVQAPKLMHGKTSAIRHKGQSILRGLPNPFFATRYHSLAVEKASLPPGLEITAEAEDGVIMGLQHKTHAVFGVQFHPESILTEHGKALLRNFLDILN